VSAASHQLPAPAGRRAARSATLLPPRSDLDLIERADLTLDVLQGKWKVHLLVIMARGVRRHSRLLECLPGASKKVMTDTLRALERDGLVARQIFAEVPVRVEYSLTPLGWSVTGALVALSDWGELHAAEVAEARADHRFGASRRHAGDAAAPSRSAAA
jgi:DNA-binding HxlR family transcriptional regulator